MGERHSANNELEMSDSFLCETHCFLRQWQDVGDWLDREWDTELEEHLVSHIWIEQNIGQCLGLRLAKAEILRLN